VADYVQIANLAGALIGTGAYVTGPDDDRSFARRVRKVWDLQRRATIREGEWNFAAQREGLAALAEPPAYPWQYGYELPARALRLIELIDAPRDGYRLEGGWLEQPDPYALGTPAARRVRILTNIAPPLYVRYMVDVVETALWDEQFAEALAARIAWACGKPVAGSTYDVEAGWRIYQAKLAASKSTDARENPPLAQEESWWVEARGGYYSGGSDPLRWG
jgi:hypothetical protein